MAQVIEDRVKELAVVTGTGSITLVASNGGRAPGGFLCFAEKMNNADTGYVCIRDTITNAFEIGPTTFTSGTTPTLSRGTPTSSSASGASISFAGNTCEIFLTAPGKLLPLLTGAAFTGQVAVNSPTGVPPIIFGTNQNGILPPAIFGGSLGFNYTAGQTEVDFFNSAAGYGGSSGFRWYQYLTGTTVLQIGSLDKSGNFTIPGALIANSLQVSGSPNLPLFSGQGSLSWNYSSNGEVNFWNVQGYPSPSFDWRQRVIIATIATNAASTASTTISLANTTGVVVGHTVSGSGIVGFPTVVSIVSGTSVTLSTAQTVASGVNLQFSQISVLAQLYSTGAMTLTAGLSATALTIGGVATGPSKVTVFLTSGTFTKQSWSTTVETEVWGAGGGAGAGYVGAASTATSGGGGGGGGGKRIVRYRAADVPLTALTVTIGAGGVGATTLGGNGAAGGSTTFWGFTVGGGGGGSGGGTVASAGGGGGAAIGAGTTASGATAGTSANSVLLPVGSGGSGTSATPSTAPMSATGGSGCAVGGIGSIGMPALDAGGGGASGGGVTAANVAQAGTVAFDATTFQVAGGAAPGGAGSAAGALAYGIPFSIGGGSGAAGITVNGGRGGNGQLPGGGGGGGGSTQTGYVQGNGGNGGNGLVIVREW